MPYQPIHPHPYLETIDAEDLLGNGFSVVINPRDIIAKYNFYIYDTKFNSIYNKTFELEEGKYIYGTEEGYELVINIENGELGTGEEAIVKNGENYYWQIELFDSLDKSIKSPFYYFSAKKEPVITLPEIPTITTCEYEFKATYKQEQNEPYLCYKYSLYRIDEKVNSEILIDETSDKTDSQLSYKYDGFVAGNKYKIKLTVTTQDKKELEESVVFDVDYDNIPPLLEVKTSTDSKNNCVKIDYSQSWYIEGVANYSPTYETYIDENDMEIPLLLIPDEAKSVYYNRINSTTPLPIDENDFTAYYSVHFHENFAGKIIELHDEISGTSYFVGYNKYNNALDEVHESISFYYKIGNGDWRYIDPYVNENGEPIRTSVVTDSVTTLEDINEDALYLLYADDMIYADSVIIYNDIAYNFWWNFVLLPNELKVYRGEKYNPKNYKGGEA